MSLKAKIETPKQKLQELWEFAKIMANIVFAIAVLGAGFYTIVEATNFTIVWQRYLVFVAGTAAVVKGTELLYQAVMRK